MLRIGLLGMRLDLAAKPQQLFSGYHVVKGPELLGKLFKAFAPVEILDRRHNRPPPGPGLGMTDDRPPTRRHAFMVRQSGSTESDQLGNRSRSTLMNAVPARFESSPSGDTQRVQASQNR